MPERQVFSNMSLVYTAEHLTLPGLYSEVIDDMEDESEDDYNDDESCDCRSCSSTPSSESAGFEASYLYHRFASSLRVAPVFRNFQVPKYDVFIRVS